MAEIHWYYAHDQQQLGPVTSAELKRLATVGQLAPDDLVWREGMEEWAPAVRVKGLFPQREAAPAEPAPPAEVRPPEPQAPPSAMSDVRLASAIVPPPAPAPDVAALGPPASAPSASVVLPVAPLSEALPHEPFTPGLRLILIAAQAVLWATCVMVVLLSGLLFIVATLKAKSVAEQADSAAISCTLFVGAYVLARSGQHLATLVEQFLRTRQR